MHACVTHCNATKPGEGYYAVASDKVQQRRMDILDVQNGLRGVSHIYCFAIAYVHFLAGCISQQCMIFRLQISIIVTNK